MTNPHRGEFRLEIDGKELVLLYTINALCEAEEAAGTNILGDLTRLSSLRLIFWAGLRTRQPEISKAKAGDLIQAAGVDVVQRAVTDALALAFPKREAGEAGANPQ